VVGTRKIIRPVPRHVVSQRLLAIPSRICTGDAAVEDVAREWADTDASPLISTADLLCPEKKAFLVKIPGQDE